MSSREWMSDARCVDVDPEVFFPTSVGAGARLQAEVAQRICGQCPVMAECAKYAKDHQIPFGIWGGVYRKLDAIASVRAPFAVEHGTNKGYRWHMRRGQTACEECRIAHRYACAEYQSKRIVSTPMDYAACGTEANAAAHRRRGERPCGACRRAETRAKDERQRKRRGA